MALQATLYLWPYLNGGLGRLTAEIKEIDGSQRSHYVSWPGGTPLKKELTSLNCLAIQLPLHHEKKFDQFIRLFAMTPYYFDSDRPEFLRLVAESPHTLSPDIRQFARKKNWDNTLLIHNIRSAKLATDSCLFTHHSCAHAVMHALYCAGYLTKVPLNDIWKTPYYQARKATKDVMSFFLTTLAPLLSQSFTDDMTAKMADLPLQLGFKPQTTIESTEFKQLDQQIYLLHLIKLLKKVDKKQGAQLERELEHHTPDPLNFVCMNLLVSIRKFCNNYDSFRWHLGDVIYTYLKHYLEGQMSFSQAKQQCMQIIHEHRNHPHFLLDPRLKVFNALITLFTLGIFNLIHKAVTGNWMFFRTHCPGRVLAKVERQLGEMEKLLVKRPM